MTQTRPASRRTRLWLPLVGLGLFALVPLGGTLHRMIWMANPPTGVTGFEAAIADRPLALLLHAAGALAFTGLGAAQLTPGLRQRAPQVHRRLGYLAWSAGMAMALTGIWLILAFPWSEGSGIWAQVVRGGVALVMVYWLIAGLTAARARDLRRHRAHMIRAWVIGAGATTNALLLGIWSAAGMTMTDNAFAGIMAIGWALAIAFVECRVIRRGTPLSSSHPLSPPANGHAGQT